MTIRAITSLYDDYDDAAHTVSDLKAAGIPASEISMVANNYDDRHTQEIAPSAAATGAGAGATVGGVLGGGAALLAGLGILAIPGVGPVVAAGWLVTTLVGAVAGAGVGAATGGLVGSLTAAGVSQEHANVYVEGVRRGGTLVTVRADETTRAVAEPIMQRHHPVNPDVRAKDYRENDWTVFDEKAAPYTEAERAQDRARDLDNRPL
jgi:hypothetical protein